MSAPTPPPFDLDELRSQVEKLDGGTWRVEKTLRSTPYGETQLVYRNGSEAGPFIRKLIPSDVQQGNAYDIIFSAQASGKRFMHVPVIYDFTKTDSGVSVVMEYVPGKTLREYVANVGPGDRAARFAAQTLCDALVEIHTALATPIIHRDIKPGNVMVSPVGVTFIDLDITRSWKAGAERDTLHFGTPGYAPPEQFGFEQTGVTGDIFATGMTLAFCCTGEDPTAALRESGFDDPRVPAWIRPILVRATQFDPAARYQSAAEMRKDVLAAMGGHAVGTERVAPQGVRQPAASSHAAKERRQGHGPTTPQPSYEAESSPASPRQNAPTANNVALKYIWNAFVVVLFLYFVAMVTSAFVTTLGNPDTGFVALLQSRPVAAIVAVVEIVGIYAIMVLCLYLALFKIRLRRIEPFSRFTWRQELPVGIGIIVVFYIVVYLVNTLPL